jgi:gliding motility-associated-like protein
MTRFKQHLWLLGFLIALKAFGTNTNTPTHDLPIVDQVNLHISSVTANIGDIVPIEFKVGGFTNIEYFNTQINWNTSYLEFVSVSDINMVTGKPSDFNTTSASTGKIVLNWSSFTPLSLADSTTIFRLNFRVKSYTGLPVPIFVASATVYQTNREPIALNSFSGYISIRNNGSCNGRAAGLSCADAPLLCPGDFPYCNKLPTPVGVPYTFANCGTVENAHFFYFDADSPSITFKIGAANCQTFQGVQFRVFETTDCNVFVRVLCGANNPVASNDKVEYEVTPLVVGKRYLLMIDGYNADLCDYTMEIVKGSIGGIPRVSPSEIMGLSSVCPTEKNMTYSINNRIDAVAYEWRVDGGGTIVSGQGTNSIQVNWGSSAGAVCLKVLGTCSQSDFACKPVALNPPVITPLIKEICAGDSVIVAGQSFNKTGLFSVKITNGSYTGCDSIISLNLSVLPAILFTKNLPQTICPTDSVVINGQVYNKTGFYPIRIKNGSYSGCDSIVNLNLTVRDINLFSKKMPLTLCPKDSVVIGGQVYNTSGNYTILLKNAAVSGCDSIVTLNLTVLNAALSTKTIDSIICKGGSVKIGTQTFSSTGNFTIPLPKASFTGCDSTVILKLTVMDITADPVSKSGDITCALKTVTLKGSATLNPLTATLSYEWKNAAGTVIGTTPSVSVTQGGAYSLKITAVGSTCEKVLPIIVDKTGGVPDRPELRGDVVTCEARAVTYTIVNQGADVSKYNWTITGGTINTGAGTSTVSVTWGANKIGRICVNAENGCGVSDSTCLAINIGKVPGSLVILGSKNVCPNATTTYSVQNPSPDVTYQWTIPVGATIRRADPDRIDISWGNNPGGEVCVTPSNTCGTGLPSCITVKLSNTAPDSIPITGLAIVCPGDMDTLRVLPDAAITKYSWRVSSNVTILSGANSPNLALRYNSGSDALIILDLQNSCNLTRSETHYTKVISALPADLPIVGDKEPCSNDTTTYSVVGGDSTIIAYKWSVPKGASLISGQGSKSIKVAWDTVTTGKICLQLTGNKCDLKRDICYFIDVRKSAVDSFEVNGPDKVCPGSTASYFVYANTKYKAFNWRVPANGTIVSGQGTNQVEIKWGAIDVGNLCLEVTNICNIKRTSCLPISVQTGLDSLPLTGAREVCEGGLATFSVQEDPDAISYAWRLPTGATIVSGRGTNEIQVRFGSVGGQIVARPIGGCADKPSTLNVSLKNPPNPPATLTGATTICQGDTASYRASAVVGIKGYKWQVPAGAIIIGSDSSAVVLVRWSAPTGGKVSVRTKNECKESVEKKLDILVNPLPQPKAGIDDSICGKQYTLKGGFSIGTPVWRVREKPTGSSLLFSDTTKANAIISVTQAGKYILTLSEKSKDCATITDTVIIVFRESPKLTLVTEDCINEGAQFTFKGTITGTAPFKFANATVGSFVGNEVTTTPFTEGSSYSLTVKDVFGCESNTLTGVKNCPCVTRSAVLRNRPIVACFGQMGKVDMEKEAILDANDNFEYILFDSTGNATGKVLQTNKTGEFAFDTTKMQYDRTYYIQHRSGNTLNGLVNTADRCYGPSNSVPVIFKNKLTASLKGDTVICANSGANLTFKTNSTGVFSLTYKNLKENISVPQSNVKSNTNYTVSPAVSTVYKLVAVSDQNGCPAQIVDSATVNIRPKLFGEAGVDQSICIKTGQLSATIPPQYKINWRSLTGADIAGVNNPNTAVSNLKNGKNSFILTTTDSICTAYRSFDTVSIFMPIIPKALNLSLEMFIGDTITGDLSEKAPVGAYNVTRLTNPNTGRFDVFNNGTFKYISDLNFSGIAKFRFMVCSESCTGVCDSGDVRILVKPKPTKIDTFEVNIPNAITPNDDGKNDVLVIDNIEKFPKAELTIFNRWGDILFIGRNYSNTWGGTNQKGESLPEGTYYFILRLNLNDGKILRGDMTILR